MHQSLIPKNKQISGKSSSKVLDSRPGKLTSLDESLF